jgi:methyl-accepting chemotaxis protein
MIERIRQVGVRVIGAATTSGRFGLRFAATAVLLLGAFGYVAYLQYTGVTDSIEFNARERVGVRYIAHAKNVLRAVQEHRIVQAAVLAGYPQYTERLQASVEAVDSALARMEATDQADGALLRTTARWNEIKSAWTVVRTSGAGLAESEKAHRALASLIVDWILNHAGNYSNLILDPDLDSYWLMDAYVSKLPGIAQQVSDLTVQGLQRRAGVARDALLEMAGTHASLSKLASDLIAVNMKTAFRETRDGGLEAALGDGATRLRSRVSRFTDRLRGVVLAAEAAPEAVSVDDSLEVLKLTYDFYDRVGPRLDALVSARVARYQGRRTTGLLSGVVAAAVIAFMLASLARAYRSATGALAEAQRLRDQLQCDQDELQSNIMELLQAVSEASDGDLTVRARVTAGALGNVADAFNNLMGSLATLVREIQGQLMQTTSVVQQIRSASQRMAEGATAQVQQVAAANGLVEQMTGQIGNVSSIAESAADAAKRAKDSAEQGSEAVQNVVTGMQALRQNVQAGAKKMKNLGDRSMEITSIVSTIQRISEQTNMLALNAAIEAARAGEHGRGFTVVADEVRKLAERTAAATAEIDQKVKAIHQETTETVQAIEQQTQVVEEEASVVGTAGQSLDRILSVSNRSFDLVAGIRGVTSEQVLGTRQVVATMEQISRIASETQDGAAATLSTIEQLFARSEHLAAAVRQFRL